MFIKISFETKKTVRAGKPIKTVRAGKDLRGTLHIEAKRDLQTNPIEFFFHGQEKLKVFHRVGERVRTYDEKKNLIHLNVPTTGINNHIQINNGTLTKGSYELPFSIHIPSHIPSSCDFGDCNDSAKVEYTLQAILTKSGFVEDYHAREVIHVEAKPRPVKTIPYHVPPQCEVIMGGVFFVRGLVAAGAEVDDTLLIPGQQMKLDIAVVNDSLASVHKIRAELRETAKWTVNEHKRSDTKTILEESWEATGDSMKKKESSPLSSNPFKQMPKGLDPTKYFEEVENHLKAHDEHLLSLQLPPLPEGANNTYVGTYMTVTHELRVTLVTHALNSDPEFKIPVRVARGYYL